MKLHPRLSRAAVELVKRFETFEPHARSTAHGGWTLGYGHTRTAREGASVSRQDAEALLLYDLSAAAELVSQTVFAPLNVVQFDALTAFAFNVGPENFRGSSALARVNAGAYLDAADEIERWRLAELGTGAQVVDTLVRRRAAEKAHFLSLPAGASTSPSGMLRPLTGPDAGPIVSGDPDAVQVAAIHGGGVAPEAASAPSAVLTAANSVQARLRELIPDAPFEAVHPAPPPPEPAAVLESHEAPAPFLTAPLAEVIGVAAPILAAGGLVEHAEPPPPPFANDHGPATVDPLSEDGLDGPIQGEASASERAVTPPAKASVKARPPLLRFAPHIVALIGLILFAGAVAMILKGQPNLVSLGMGLVGAVGMAGALYTLMGRSSI